MASETPPPGLAVQPVSIAAGQDVATGTPSDAAATSFSTAGTVVSWLRGIYNALLSPARQMYLASTSTNLAAGATIGDGSFVNLGPSPSPFSYIVGFFLSNQSGTYYIQAYDSVGNAYATLTTGSLTANTSVTVRISAIAMSSGTRFRAFIVNGATAATSVYTSVALTAA